MASANNCKSLESLLDRAVADDGITEDALDFLFDHRIACPSGNRNTIISLAYANGWRETTDLGWRG